MAIIAMCDLCGAPAIYDAPGNIELRGRWAYFCQECYNRYANHSFPATILAKVK
jgi:hypothetical protein